MTSFLLGKTAVNTILFDAVTHRHRRRCFAHRSFVRFVVSIVSFVRSVARAQKNQGVGVFVLFSQPQPPPLFVTLPTVLTSVTGLR
jgi:hypothetical protein